MKEWIPTSQKYYTQQNYPSEKKKKVFLKQTKLKFINRLVL